MLRSRVPLKQRVGSLCHTLDVLGFVIRFWSAHYTVQPLPCAMGVHGMPVTCIGEGYRYGNIQDEQQPGPSAPAVINNEGVESRLDVTQGPLPQWLHSAGYVY